MKTLNFSNSKLTDVDTVEFSPDLSSEKMIVREIVALLANQNSTVLRMVYNGENSTEDSFVAIAEALALNQTLCTLEFINSHSLGMRGMEALGCALEKNTKLLKLSFRSNLSKLAIDDAMFVPLARAMQRNVGLTSLIVENQNIGDASVVALAESLLANPKSELNYLSLAGNKLIGLPSILSLAKLLKNKNCKIEYLNLENLELQDEKIIQVLAEAFRENRSLVKIHLPKFITPVVNESKPTQLEFNTVTSREKAVLSLGDVIKASQHIVYCSELVYNVIHILGLPELPLLFLETHSQMNTKYCALRAQSKSKNWAQIAVAASFVRANSTNAFRFSVLPLLVAILRMVDLEAVDGRILLLPDSSSSSSSPSLTFSEQVEMAGKAINKPTLLPTEQKSASSSSSSSSPSPVETKTGSINIDQFSHTLFFKAHVASGQFAQSASFTDPVVEQGRDHKRKLKSLSSSSSSSSSSHTPANRSV